MTALVDRFGRRFPYLRLSVIEACNFRCSYCLPDGYHAVPGRPAPLTLAEIGRLLTAFASVGMHKLRITGGEPSLRRDLNQIIALAAATPGIRNIAMTTNGVRIDQLAGWRRAGLTAINVSVDSLDRERFKGITGYDRLPSILAGIEQALGLGFHAVKLNAVLLRGRNDHELPAWFDYLRTRRISLRFIELMQTGDNLDYFHRHHVSASALVADLQQAGWQELPRLADAGPAVEFTHADYAGRIGIIAPYAKNFCAACNRLRVTATGDLRLCLFGTSGTPLRPLLQSDADQAALTASIATQLGLKLAAHALHDGQTGITPHLASIGG